MEVYEVSTAVNRVANDSPELLEPLQRRCRRRCGCTGRNGPTTIGVRADLEARAEAAAGKGYRPGLAFLIHVPAPAR